MPVMSSTREYAVMGWGVGGVWVRTRSPSCGVEIKDIHNRQCIHIKTN